jgi:hypothetical protein
MPDRFTRLKMDPDLRIVLNRRIRHEPKFVAVGETAHVLIATGEDGAMNRRAEQWWLTIRKRRKPVRHSVSIGGDRVGREQRLD